MCLILFVRNLIRFSSCIVQLNGNDNGGTRSDPAVTPKKPRHPKSYSSMRSTATLHLRSADASFGPICYSSSSDDDEDGNPKAKRGAREGLPGPVCVVQCVMMMCVWKCVCVRIWVYLRGRRGVPESGWPCMRCVVYHDDECGYGLTCEGDEGARERLAVYALCSVS